MNTEIFEMRWKEVKGVIQFLWGKITDSELETSKGDLNSLTQIIHEKYGEEAEVIKTRLEPILFKLSDISEEMKEYFHEEEFHPSTYTPSSTYIDQNNRDISAI